MKRWTISTPTYARPSILCVRACVRVMRECIEATHVRWCREIKKAEWSIHRVIILSSFQKSSHENVQFQFNARQNKWPSSAEARNYKRTRMENNRKGKKKKDSARKLQKPYFFKSPGKSRALTETWMSETTAFFFFLVFVFFKTEYKD